MFDYFFNIEQVLEIENGQSMKRYVKRRLFIVAYYKPNRNVTHSTQMLRRSINSVTLYFVFLFYNNKYVAVYCVHDIKF